MEKISSEISRQRLESTRTHPWISFAFDPNALPGPVWGMLGQGESKCLHLQRTPLKPEVARKMHRIALIKGAQATAAIEGNTLSEEQVSAAAQGTLEAPPSLRYQQVEIENILGALNELGESLGHRDAAPLELSPAWFNHWNGRLLDGAKLDDDVVPGEVRAHSVVVGGNYRGAPARDCPALLDMLGRWVSGPELKPNDAAPATHAPSSFASAFIRATVTHLYVEWIHPYGDGNGRLGRLAEFAVLMDAGLSLPAALQLSQHYNRTKAEYYRVLAQSTSDGSRGVAQFIAYAAQGFVDQMQSLLDDVADQVADSTWREFLYETLPATTAAERRCRKLALALPTDRIGKSRSDIPTLTSELAQAYAHATGKTVTRDINTLLRSGIAVEADGKLLANTAMLRDRLPLGRERDEQWRLDH